jgi:hypothetical protein
MNAALSSPGNMLRAQRHSVHVPAIIQLVQPLETIGGTKSTQLPPRRCLIALSSVVSV